MDEKEWLDTLPEDERLKVIAEHNKTIAQLKQPIDRVQDDAPDRWSRLQATADKQRIAELEADNIDLSEEYAKTTRLLGEANKRIRELEEQLMIEKEFGMHYHAEFMKLFEKGVEQDERIAEQDLLLAQWESIDELNRERSQQRLQRIAQLEAESNRRLELLIEIYETDGVGLTSYILVKIEEELGDDYFNRHTT